MIPPYHEMSCRTINITNTMNYYQVGFISRERRGAGKERDAMLVPLLQPPRCCIVLSASFVFLVVATLLVYI